MTNKEMVEEMANQLKELASIIRKVLTERVDIQYIPDLAFPVAKELLKYYQPKLSEGSVVLSKEEYEKVKYVLKYEPEEAIIRLEDLTKNERLYSPHMFCSLGGCSGVRKGCNRTCKESWIVIERKETAEKFAKMAKDRWSAHWESYCENINELAKQFGAEMEEN